MDTASRARDEWIALRCQSGEPDAFEDLVAEMERPLLYYASKLLGNEERALDALQDVWMRVFRGIRRMKDPGSLRPWLYRVTDQADAVTSIGASSLSAQRERLKQSLPRHSRPPVGLSS
jgi:hypothetical protein